MVNVLCFVDGDIYITMLSSHSDIPENNSPTANPDLFFRLGTFGVSIDYGVLLEVHPPSVGLVRGGKDLSAPLTLRRPVKVAIRVSK